MGSIDGEIPAVWFLISSIGLSLINIGIQERALRTYFIQLSKLPSYVILLTKRTIYHHIHIILYYL